VNGVVIGRARSRPAWRVAAGVVAAAGVLPGVRALLSPVSDRAYVLMLFACLLPGAVLLGTRPRARRPVAVLLLVAGAVIVLVGAVQASGDYALNLYLATLGPWTLISFGSALTPFPLGLALVLAGLGLLLGRRWLLVVGLLVAALTAGWFTGASLAGPVSMADEYGFWLDKGALVVTAVFAVATCLLLALALRSRTALGDLAPPVSRPAGPRRRAPMVVAALTVLVLVGIAVGWWFVLAPRLVLEETFPDLALARCVAGALGERDTSATVSSSALGQVLSLTCNGDRNAEGDDGAAPQALDAFRMHSLEGAERLENLASLDLTGNRISDLGPLAGLPKLAQLTLTGNEVADLSPLASLPVLTDLGLSGNQVTDVVPLAGVPTLRLLGLADNGIEDVTPLEGLVSLSELDLSRNQIVDVTPLAGLAQVDRLQLTDNRITDLTPLGRLTALTVLDVAGNQVADVGGLAGCTSLDELWLGRNPLSDVSALLALPALAGVDLEGLDPVTTAGVVELRAQGIYVGGFA
jgi:internalin A